MARRWWLCPLAVGHAGRQTARPSDVPSSADSMSCVASALPAKSTSIQPAAISRSRYMPAPVWMMAGPADEEDLQAARAHVGHAPRHRGDGQLLGPLGRDLARHEAEHVRRVLARRRHDLHARGRRRGRGRPCCTRCTGVQIACGPSARSRSTTPQSISMCVDRQPAPAGADERREVGRRVELLREHAVRRGRAPTRPRGPATSRRAGRLPAGCGAGPARSGARTTISAWLASSRVVPMWKCVIS